MRPLLAYTIKDTTKIKYPVIVSPKLDGVRCLGIDGVAMSRQMKPIPNKYVQSFFAGGELNGLDGELIVGDVEAKDCYRTTVSGVMSEDGEPAFLFWAFDLFDSGAGNLERIQALGGLSELPRTRVVPQFLCDCEEDLLFAETKFLDLGYEGLMVRSLDGLYKNGRSTEKEGILGKLKRFTDEEFEVIGFQERQHNENPSELNELGYAKRSSHQDNKVGVGDLGALVLRKGDVEFCCGTGFSDEDRSYIWENKEQFIGKMAKVKYFNIGMKTAPRHPVFLGWRDRND